MPLRNLSTAELSELFARAKSRHMSWEGEQPRALDRAYQFMTFLEGLRPKHTRLTPKQLEYLCDLAGVSTSVLYTERFDDLLSVKDFAKLYHRIELKHPWMFRDENVHIREARFWGTVGRYRLGEYYHFTRAQTWWMRYMDSTRYKPKDFESVAAMIKRYAV